MMKYNEDIILAEVEEYIESTYSSHYAKGDSLQTLDVYKALGSAQTTCRDTAIKYLMRYGEKDGFNRKDMIKAIHYIVLILGINDKDKDDINNINPNKGNNNEFNTRR
tara:strand:+ start:748 stop:1071 length:324 start_codon:yes stop_codon:yes gene_type:complete